MSDSNEEVINFYWVKNVCIELVKKKWIWVKGFNHDTTNGEFFKIRLPLKKFLLNFGNTTGWKLRHLIIFYTMLKTDVYKRQFHLLFSLLPNTFNFDRLKHFTQTITITHFYLLQPIENFTYHKFISFLFKSINTLKTYYYILIPNILHAINTIRHNKNIIGSI